MNQNRHKPQDPLAPPRFSEKRESATVYLALLGTILSLLTIILSLLTAALHFAEILLFVLLGSVLLIGLSAIVYTLRSYTIFRVIPVAKSDNPVRKKREQLPRL